MYGRMDGAPRINLSRDVSTAAADSMQRRIFRLHRMHEIRTIVIDERGVCPPVCLSRGSTRLRYAETAKRIKILFGVNILGGPRNILLDGGTSPPQLRGGWGIVSHCGPATLYRKNG